MFLYAVFCFYKRLMNFFAVNAVNAIDTAILTVSEMFSLTPLTL